MAYKSFSLSGIAETGYAPATKILPVLLLILFFAAELPAQTITYESLRSRDRQPNVFLDHVVLPDPGSADQTLVTLFRIENNFLSYRRYRDGASQNDLRQFYSDPLLRLEIRNIEENEESPVMRTWNETVYAETYEQTQSTTSFVQNKLTTSLAPGTYTIESTIRSDNRTRRGRTPRLRIADAGSTEIAYLYFLENTAEVSAPFYAPLLNMGRNVFFGRDYQLAVWFPGFKDDVSYRFEIDQLRIRRQDTTKTGRVFEYSINNDSLLTGYMAEVGMDDNRPNFRLVKTEQVVETGRFYVLTIPNSTFENAPYHIRLIKEDDEGGETVIAERVYQSLWLDMPVSLLNLDVAINMMEFILDDNTLRSMQRGSRDERERRFREFWRERDPNPEDEYNELMVEYFRRIDYAYENFTTPSTPGYESDQGRIYIRNGEPRERQRTFPPNQPAREIWHYRDQTFVFEATTGFGDYRLVERR